MIQNYEKEIERQTAENQDYQPASYHTLSKADLKTYLDAFGCPPLPATRATMVFYRELMQKGLLDHIPGTKRMGEMMRQYKEMSQKEKNKYKLKYEEVSVSGGGG